MIAIDPRLYPLDCEGSIVAGDVILFSESVFVRHPGRWVFTGIRRIVADVIRESRSVNDGDHRFILCVQVSDGVAPVKEGRTWRKRSKLLHLKGIKRRRWPDEVARSRAVGDGVGRHEADRWINRD